MSLLRTLKEAEERNKVDVKALLASYRAIIERDSQPAEGDADALRGLMQQLGLTTADVESDLWALRQLREFRRQAAEAGETDEQRQARATQVESLRADLLRAQEEVKRLERELQRTTSEGMARSMRLSGAHESIRGLARQNPRVFEDPRYLG